MDFWRKSDDDKVARCREKGIQPEQHCCLNLAFAISAPIFIEHQGENPIIQWSAMWNEYRIPVPLQGYSSTRISHCPFCGAVLPESKQELWFETLYGLGYYDPGEEDIPDEYTTDAWWREGP